MGEARRRKPQPQTEAVELPDWMLALAPAEAWARSESRGVAVRQAPPGADDADHAWFAAHPERTYRVRPITPRERRNRAPGVRSEWTGVMRTEPDGRLLRMLVDAVGHVPDTEDAARWLVEQMLRRTSAGVNGRPIPLDCPWFSRARPERADG